MLKSKKFNRLLSNTDIEKLKNKSKLPGLDTEEVRQHLKAIGPEIINYNGDINLLETKDKILLLLFFQNIKSSNLKYSDINIIDIANYGYDLGIEFIFGDSLGDTIDTEDLFDLEGDIRQLFSGDINDDLKNKVREKFKILFENLKKTKGIDRSKKALVYIMKEAISTFSLFYHTRLSLGLSPEHAMYDALEINPMDNIRKHKVVGPIEIMKKNGASLGGIGYFIDYYFLAGNIKRLNRGLILNHEKEIFDSLNSLNIIALTQFFGIKYAKLLGERITVFLANKFPQITTLPDQFNKYYIKYLQQLDRQYLN